MSTSFDVVVVGGGAAGLSGALTLARARRSVLVVDAGQPRNAPADGVHNYLGREGTPPAELLAIGRSEVAGYGGTITEGRVESARPVDAGFEVSLADGRRVTARRLLVATGLVDELPDVKGLAERWGRDVMHCPYCHGWEVRDQAIGVLSTGPMAAHQALLLRQWSDNVTLFAHEGPALTGPQRQQLAARGIDVVAGEVVDLEVTDDKLTGVRLGSGAVVACDALAVAPRFIARHDVLASLGLAATDQMVGDLAIGRRVAPVDQTGATEVPGVWVAGNVGDAMTGVLQAAAAGFAAATAINADLVQEDTARAVARFQTFSGQTGLTTG